MQQAEETLIFQAIDFLLERPPLAKCYENKKREEAGKPLLETLHAHYL